MTTEGASVYVWTWLPGETEPVVAGDIEYRASTYNFTYAPSYLARPDRISLYGPELPLGPDENRPVGNLTLAGRIRDGLPDGWGRAVIDARENLPEGVLTELDYMRKSGSSRFGANDFQHDPRTYVPRTESATLDELHEAAQRLIRHEPISQSLKDALVNGSAMGGARPKALIRDGDVEYIAKFSSSSDVIFPVVNVEATAMLLAVKAGLNVSEVTVTESANRSVLLVRRFDRDGARRMHTVSGLTMLELPDTTIFGWSYPKILDVLREHGSDPKGAGPELFERIAYNMAISNSDDHPRNHAAFWDGKHLTLTPAFDLAPGARSGETATQAMDYGRDGERQSTFADLIGQVHVYGLNAQQGRERIDRIETAIREHWNDATAEAQLPGGYRKQVFGTQFLNPGLFHGYREPLVHIGWSGSSGEQPRHGSGSPGGIGGR